MRILFFSFDNIFPRSEPEGDKEENGVIQLSDNGQLSETELNADDKGKKEETSDEKDDKGKKEETSDKEDDKGKKEETSDEEDDKGKKEETSDEVTNICKTTKITPNIGEGDNKETDV